jgi:hypothetical protein
MFISVDFEAEHFFMTLYQAFFFGLGGGVQGQGLHTKRFENCYQQLPVLPV